MSPFPKHDDEMALTEAQGSPFVVSYDSSAEDMEVARLMNDNNSADDMEVARFLNDIDE